MAAKKNIEVGQFYEYSKEIKNQKGLTEYQKFQLSTVWKITRVINVGGKNYIETEPRINEKRTLQDTFLKYTVLSKKKKVVSPF